MRPAILALTVLAPTVLVLAPGLAAAQEANRDAAIDARIQASAEAAESLQGPLDGHWTLVGADGKAIYAFQLVDHPSPNEPPEGVWRDLRRPQVPGDIGFVDSLQKAPGQLTMSFNTGGPSATNVSLKQGPDGLWTGQLTEDGATTAVTLRRG